MVSDGVSDGIHNWMEQATARLIVIEVKQYMPGVSMAMSESFFGEISREASIILKQYVRGRQWLIPAADAKLMISPITTCRRWLRTHGFTTRWGVAIPTRIFDKWKDVFGRNVRTFNERRDNLVNDFSNKMGRVVDDYRHLADELFDNVEDRERFMRIIINRLPDKDIVASYSLSFTVDKISIPTNDDPSVDIMMSYAKSEVEKEAIEAYRANVNERVKAVTEEFIPMIYSQMLDVIRKKLETYYDILKKTGEAPRRMLRGIRTAVVTATDLNAVVGDIPFQKKLDVLAKKLGTIVEGDDQEAVRDIKKATRNILKYIDARMEDIDVESGINFSKLAFLDASRDEVDETISKSEKRWKRLS